MINLKNYIKLFEDNKIQIIKLWINNDDILRVLNKYKISKKLFVKNYAISILDYYINIIKDINDKEDCSVINNLLTYLKDRDIGIDELYTICSGFRNAFIDFTYTVNINSVTIQKELLYIYEKNFKETLLG